VANITISFALAYLLAGLSQVTEDLAADPISKPMWALRPTFGMMLLVGMTWFTRPFVGAVHSPQVARNVAFAGLKVIVPFVMTAAFVWVCITTSEHWFDNVALRILAIAVLLLVGARFVLPWLSLLTLPLTWIIALPIDLLFPLKKSDKTQEIKWCKNCEHYRSSEGYEDIIRGLWRSTSMPRSGELPCNIADETSEVWERYFRLEVTSRALYPKDCPYFHWRAK
jgi:hypothetical protein